MNSTFNRFLRDVESRSPSDGGSGGRNRCPSDGGSGGR